MESEWARCSERGEVAVEVQSQITGNIWKIERAVGDVVAEEDVLLIIESMKMEIPLEAPCDGRVGEIRVEEGQSVEEGDILVVLEG
jgi:acetyl-CoA carboxylase biotin carboxyl carrier protein